MKAYISISIKNRKPANREVEAIVQVLKEFNIASFVFIDHYKFDLSQEREMMNTAMAEIDSSDLLIAECTDKGIGIGVEVGYAKAKGKPVVYLRQLDAEHSTTVSGASDFQVIYSDATMLRLKLAEVIAKLSGSDSK